jgi:putative transposase
VTHGAQRGRATLAVSFKGAHVPTEIMLTGVRWSGAYSWSTRQVEARLRARRGAADHAPIDRRVVKDSSRLEEALHRRKRPVWSSWRLDETSSQVTGAWRYLDRAVDTHGQTIDILLTDQRDEQAATRFLTKDIRRHGVPETITMDGSAANAAAMRRANTAHDAIIVRRQVKELNHIVEQDHRGVKRVTRPMLGYKSCEAAQSTLAGVALMQLFKDRADGRRRG